MFASFIRISESLHASQISAQTSRASILAPIFPCGINDVLRFLPSSCYNSLRISHVYTSCQLFLYLRVQRIKRAQLFLVKQWSVKNHQHFQHFSLRISQQTLRIWTPNLSSRDATVHHPPATLGCFLGGPERMIAPNSPIASEASLKGCWKFLGKLPANFGSTCTPQPRIPSSEPGGIAFLGDQGSRKP